MPLIKYAGYDPEEGAGGYYRSKHAEKRWRNFTRAYNMFLSGRDTIDIAEAFGVEEPLALKWVNIARADHLGLPNPYEA